MEAFTSGRISHTAMKRYAEQRRYTKADIERHFEISNGRVTMHHFESCIDRARTLGGTALDKKYHTGKD